MEAGWEGLRGPGPGPGPSATKRSPSARSRVSFRRDEITLTCVATSLLLLMGRPPPAPEPGARRTRRRGARASGADRPTISVRKTTMPPSALGRRLGSRLLSRPLCLCTASRGGGGREGGGREGREGGGRSVKEGGRAENVKITRRKPDRGNAIVGEEAPGRAEKGETKAPDIFCKRKQGSRAIWFEHHRCLPPRPPLPRPLKPSSAGLAPPLKRATQEAREGEGEGLCLGGRRAAKREAGALRGHEVLPDPVSLTLVPTS